jgi:hypothetical protein
MKNLDRLVRLIEFGNNQTFKFTETEEYIELEIGDSIFKQYIMKGEDVDKVKEVMFWYVIEGLIANYKTKRLND